MRPPVNPRRFALFLALAASSSAAAMPPHAIPPVSHQLKDPKAADVTVVGHILEPRKLNIKKVVEQIRLPPGFEISVFAEDLVNPRMLAVSGDGTVYVTRRSVGDVLMLRDSDGDGRADEQKTVARRPGMHGIAIKDNDVYLVTVNELYRTRIVDKGAFAPLELVLDDLPDGGQHPNRTIQVGPDDRLYLSVGSTCNACDESNPESATMLQLNPDGSQRIIFASGLRNTIGFAFHPDSGDLFGMDHGIDWLGDNEQHEELNRIVKGNQYGWPYVYDNSKFNPQDEPPGDISLRDWARKSVEPVGYYTPHAAPMQMTFYSGEQFPEDYRGDAFIAMRGSWNRKPPSGYEIVRVRFNGSSPSGFEAFATGFLRDVKGGWGHKGRLAGLAQAQDGSLLVTDDTNGVIYRIAYTGKAQRPSRPNQPTNAMGAQIRVKDQAVSSRADSLEVLAKNAMGGEGPALQVSSPAFENGGPIPELFTAYGENVSPPLSWSAGPEGTVSYAVIMEDPDVAEDPPFVHWMLYNIPAPVTRIPKGVPQAPQVPQPPDSLQGRNERGSVGYFGPKPPPEDPAHHYHFQIFALDTELKVTAPLTRDELLKAMEGHVLATGELVGTYDQ